MYKLGSKYDLKNTGCYTKDQYERFLKHFAHEETNTKSGAPQTTNMAGKINQNDSWIVDTGSTKHMTNRIDILEDVISSINEEPVTIPNGEVVPVKGRGNHTLSNETKENAFPFGTNVKENIGENDDEIPYDVGEEQVETSHEPADEEWSNHDVPDPSNVEDRQTMKETNDDTED
ncbi:hypothetical protein Tco_1326206 [Tanacetum coccineum]